MFKHVKGDGMSKEFSRETLQNALWALHGFLRGLNIEQVGNVKIDPAERKVYMTEKQYKDIDKFVMEHLNIERKNDA